MRYEGEARILGVDRRGPREQDSDRSPSLVPERANAVVRIGDQAPREAVRRAPP